MRSASNAYFPQLFSVLSLPKEDPGLSARLDAVWTILEYATAATLPGFRTIPDVAKALEGLSDGEAMALIERALSAACRRPADGPMPSIGNRAFEHAKCRSMLACRCSNYYIVRGLSAARQSSERSHLEFAGICLFGQI